MLKALWEEVLQTKQASVCTRRYQRRPRGKGILTVSGYSRSGTQPDPSWAAHQRHRDWQTSVPQRDRRRLACANSLHWIYYTGRKAKSQTSSLSRGYFFVPKKRKIREFVI